jgi:Zn-dependent alcohol dehydrogenase
LLRYASLQELELELELDEFVTHRVGFDDINSAFDLLAWGNWANASAS